MYDPWADREEVLREYDISLVQKLGGKYSAIVLAVAHNIFLDLNWAGLRASASVIYDVKGLIPRKYCDKRL